MFLIFRFDSRSFNSSYINKLVQKTQTLLIGYVQEWTNHEFGTDLLRVSRVFEKLREKLVLCSKWDVIISCFSCKTNIPEDRFHDYSKVNCCYRALCSHRENLVHCFKRKANWFSSWTICYKFKSVEASLVYRGEQYYSCWQRQYMQNVAPNARVDCIIIVTYGNAFVPIKFEPSLLEFAYLLCHLEYVNK